jgi:hypothetical protein
VPSEKLKAHQCKRDTRKWKRPTQLRLRKKFEIDFQRRWVYAVPIGTKGRPKLKNYILIAVLTVFLSGSLLLLSMPLWGVRFGLDIHFRSGYFVSPVASTAILLSLVFASAWFLILLIRAEIRRKRSG